MILWRYVKYLQMRVTVCACSLGQSAPIFQFKSFSLVVKLQIQKPAREENNVANYGKLVNW